MEAWLRGPIDGIPALLMPAAHALVQVREDVERLVRGLPADVLWATPGGAASIGFHVRHIAGSLDRLLTYARGESLSSAQMAAMIAEKAAPPDDAARLVMMVHRAVDAALAQIGATDPSTLTAARAVGRAALPATVIGLLFHAAEHATRHAGQIATTVRIVAAGSRHGGSTSEA